MRIALSSVLSKNNRFRDNLKTLKNAVLVASANGADIVLFGEAFLQGFDALSFNYFKDLNEVFGIHGPELAEIRRIAIECKSAIGFGFYENYRGGIYSSYAIINADGDFLTVYRRVSSGWRLETACADYREGKEFVNFEFGLKWFSVLLCGDFWEDDLLTRIVDFDPIVDAFLWPVHVDKVFTRSDDCFYRDYERRTEILAKPLLLRK